MTKPKPRPPWATDPALKAKVEQAAAAAGFANPADLMAALHTVVTPKEAEELSALTASMTVADVGQALYWKLYREKEKPSFFAQLTDEQKAMLIAYLTHVGFAPQTIAVELAVSEHLVREAWSRYADKLGQHVVGVRLQTLVGDLKAKADQLYQLALAKGNLHVAWKITTDFVGLLQDLNIVERAAQRQEVTHKLELDEADLQELDGLMEVRRKRDDARARIAVVETNDSIPEVKKP